LRGDGQAEIVIGRQVLDAAGNLLWSGAGDRGNQGSTGPLSILSDIDLDGTPEIIAGRTIYNGAAGGIERMGGIGDGYNAVADFIGDQRAEVVLVSNGQVQLLDANMAVIWSASIPGGGAGGPPTVADFDNDGQVEIGVAGAGQYVVFETNGAVKWTRAIQDFSSNRTGSSVFDFEGDGAAEVVYSDERSFFILDGATGAVRFQTPLSSCTWQEYPLVADVDGDGAAEIIAVGNTNCGYGVQSGIYVFGDSDDAWVNTRPLWNQHSYHVTNINLDGSIPVDEAENWLTAGLNNFRLNEYAPGEDPTEMAEPAAPGLLGLGLLGLGAAARRRRR
jgi:MYXO-CTERM domain-containing protein